MQRARVRWGAARRQADGPPRQDKLATRTARAIMDPCEFPTEAAHQALLGTPPRDLRLGAIVVFLSSSATRVMLERVARPRPLSAPRRRAGVQALVGAVSAVEVALG